MKTRKGFTLVEMLVVITIVALISVYALPGFIHSRNKAMVNNTAISMASELDEWRSKAVSGWTVLNLNTASGGVDVSDITVDGATPDQTVLPRGLVLSVDVLGDVTAFADLSGDKSDLSGTQDQHVDLSGFLKDFSDVEVVEIESDLATPVTSLKVYYASPTGEVTLYDQDGNKLQYARVSTGIWDLTPAEVPDHREMGLVGDTVIESEKSNVYICKYDSDSEICKK